jgi:hypothetical protein
MGFFAEEGCELAVDQGAGLQFWKRVMAGIGGDFVCAIDEVVDFGGVDCHEKGAHWEKDEDGGEDDELGNCESGEG